MKPNYKTALIILAIISIMSYLFYKNNSLFKLNWITVLIYLFLIFTLMNSLFGLVKFSTDNNPKGTKSYCEYSNEGFTIVDVLLEKNLFISWTSVEAIFLFNKPPGDGEYHNFEYSIILNKESIETNFENQKWYNKIFTFSKTKNKQLPLIRINDYWHKDFKTFAPAIEEYLVKTDPHLNEYLENKFGNKIMPEKKNGVTYFKSEKPLMQFGFYKIFDRNNNLKDNRLEQFREDSK